MKSFTPSVVTMKSTHLHFTRLLLSPLFAACLATAFIGSVMPALSSTLEGSAVQTPDTKSNNSPERFSGPKDVLAALGMTDSFWNSFQDGVPLLEQEREFLSRLLFHISMFRPSELEDWKQELPDFNSPDLAVQALRGQVFELVGRVVKVEKEPISPEMVERLGWDCFYQCTTVADDSKAYIVYSRDVPRAWKTQKELNEKTVIKGIFVKFAGKPPTPLPVFVTSRPGWYPDSLLGRLGMDCSLFDDVALDAPPERFVRQESDDLGLDPLEKYRLTGKDRECFYQLLAAVGRAQPGELMREAQRRLAGTGRATYSVVPLFNDPPRQQGKLFLLYGTARRIERVDIRDPDIQKRFKINHYYTIYLFTDDSQNYPIVFCVRYLPKTVVPGEGPGYAVNVAVAGFFLKTWAFRPQAALSANAPRGAWQLAPLLIGREAVALAPERNPQKVGLVTAVLFTIVAALVVVVGGFVWWINRRDRARQQRLREQFLGVELEGGTSERSRNA